MRILKKLLSDDFWLEKNQMIDILENAIEDYDLLDELFNRDDTAHLVIERKSGKVKVANRILRNMVPANRFSSYDGKSVSDVIKDKDVVSFIESVLSGKDGFQPKDFSYGEGEIKTVRVSFLPFMVDEIEYLDVRIKDITDSLKKEMKLRNSEALASMTTMAAGVAHDIKNPLAAMKIYLALLRKAVTGGKNMEKASSFIDIIEEETERLNEIAVDFLFAVKPMEFELKMDKINEIVDELVSFISIEAEEKGIKIEVKKGQFLPSLLLDRKLIRRALLNIVNNSIYALSERKDKILSFETKEDGNYVKLIVRDNGSGMDEETRKKVFEPYFTTKSAGGTGLGLTAVLKIMNVHQGEIILESEKNVGTSFTLSFPIPNSQRKGIES